MFDSLKDKFSIAKTFIKEKFVILKNYAKNKLNIVNRWTKSHKCIAICSSAAVAVIAITAIILGVSFSNISSGKANSSSTGVAAFIAGLQKGESVTDAASSAITGSNNTGNSSNSTSGTVSSGTANTNVSASGTPCNNTDSIGSGSDTNSLTSENNGMNINSSISENGTSETYVQSTGSSHVHNYVKANTVAPTCTSSGYTIYKCSCGATEKRDITSATGHSYGAWTTTKAATTSSTGTNTHTCTKCGHTETESIPKLAASSNSESPIITKTTRTDSNGTCLCVKISYPTFRYYIYDYRNHHNDLSYKPQGNGYVVSYTYDNGASHSVTLCPPNDGKHYFQARLYIYKDGNTKTSYTSIS